MNLPTMSIVTPSFNQGMYLEDTIQSVLSQGFPNLEYVIVDGGSSDNSVEIIKKYQSELHYWASEKDEGHGHALNKGFSHTSGEIMAWINSDDKYTPWSFKTVAYIFATFPHVNWIVGFNSWWNSDGAMINAARIPKNIYDFLLGNWDWIQQESVFWRRSLWEKAGGYINQNFKFMVDGELWTRFFLHERLYTFDCILGGYRFQDDNRARHNYETCLQEMDQAISTMKGKCPNDVLDTYRKLKVIKRWKDIELLKHVPISQLSRRFLCPSLFDKAKYDNIFFDHEKGMWTQRTLPFLV